MIDRAHKLSVVRQAKLLGFSRGSVYYLPRPVTDGDVALMRRIDELHLDYPFVRSQTAGFARNSIRPIDTLRGWTARRWSSMRFESPSRFTDQPLPFAAVRIAFASMSLKVVPSIHSKRRMTAYLIVRNWRILDINVVAAFFRMPDRAWSMCKENTAYDPSGPPLKTALVRRPITLQ